MSLTKRVKLLPHQYEFLTAKEKFVLLCGGIGSGKSWAGAHFIINRVIKNPKGLHFIGANTYSQLRDATLHTLFACLEDLGIEYSYNKVDGIVRFGGGKILARSMENYNVIRGIEIDTFWLDEVRDLRRDAFDMIMGRLRGKHSKDLKGYLTSSPNGFNFMFDYFSPNGEYHTDEFRIIGASSYNNPHLPDGYVESLRAQYSERLFRQEVMGEMISVNQGQVYYAFDRDITVKEVKYDPRQRIWIGMDFNVNPMTAVVAHLTSTEIHVFDEIYLGNSNTHEMAKTILSKYGAGHSIVPDSTGKALKTSSAGFSDHEILRQAGFRIESSSNPFRMDRYNAVNKMCEDKTLTISPRCVNLIKDLEQVTFKEGTNMPDTKDKSLGHISDALGYLVYKTFGIRPTGPEFGAFNRFGGSQWETV